jgi:hypothetical protein
MKIFEIINMDLLKAFTGELPTAPDAPTSVAANATPATDSTTSGNKIFVIGDSIAVGIQNAGNADGDTKAGISSTQVLEKVKAFVSSGNAKGTVVVLSSGASNSTFERPTGQGQKLDMAPINAQLVALKKAGAITVLVGTGSGQSQWISNKYGKYRVNFKAENVNAQLASAASANGAKFLGPLEDYDSGMNSGKGDGIHPFGGYTKLYQAASKYVTPSQSTKQSAGTAASGKSIATKGGKGSVNPNDVKSYLTGKGLSANHVAGIMANIKAESSFRPGAIGDNGTSGGLFQHHNERFKAMVAHAGRDWATNWKGQIDFALSEPAGRQYVAMKFSSPEAASKWFTINFERPANMVAKAYTRSLAASQFA